MIIARAKPRQIVKIHSKYMRRIAMQRDCDTYDLYSYISDEERLKLQRGEKDVPSEDRHSLNLLNLLL